MKAYRIVIPDVGRHVEALGDKPDSVVNVSVRRSPAKRRNAEELLDDLAGIVEFGECDIIGEGRHVPERIKRA